MDVAELLDEMHVGELSDKIQSLFPSMHLTLDNMLDMLFQGRVLELVRYIFREGTYGALDAVASARNALICLVLLGVVGALTMRFSDLFERFQVGELGFYVTYLLQTIVLTKCYQGLLLVAGGILEDVCQFVKLLMPTYLLSVGISAGSITAGASHQMIMLLVSLVSEVLKGCFLPLTKCFFLLTILEGVQAREQMELLLELLKKGIWWGLKGTLGIVAGLGFLQSILTPALDRVKGSAAKKLIGALPGIGDGAEGVLDLVMGSSLVIKNSVGILLTLLLLLLCMTPLLRIFAYSIALKLAAAITGIVTDKRLSKALDRAGEAGLLLLGVSGEGMLFFLITIAVTCSGVR